MIQRIIVDKPPGWEWRLAAELLRHFITPHVRRYNDLIDGYYYKPLPSVRSDEFLGWMKVRIHVMSNLANPLPKLFSRLTAAFGEPGVPGDAEEIHHVCMLIGGALAEIVNHEEVLRFTQLPDEGEELRSLLIDAVGQNLAQIVELPQKLDEMVALIGTDHGGTKENPTVVEWKGVFDLPASIETDLETAFLRFQHFHAI